MRLTSNQQATLFLVAFGVPGGMYLHTIPSLIKRGLVVEIRTLFSTPMFGLHPGAHALAWRLTPLGLETFEKLRTKQLAENMKTLQNTFDMQVGIARARTVQVTP